MIEPHTMEPRTGEFAGRLNDLHETLKGLPWVHKQFPFLIEKSGKLVDIADSYDSAQQFAADLEGRAKKGWKKRWVQYKRDPKLGAYPLIIGWLTAGTVSGLLAFIF